MADPTKYTPAYSYSGWQASNPNKPLPADEVDNDFANVSLSVNQTIDALKDVRRSDGKLKNQSVGPDQISPALTIGFTFTGTWVDGRSYGAGDGVVSDDTFYSARVAHTADVSNAPGNAAYWNELFSLNDIVVTGGMALPRDSFVGDGVTKDFTLSFTPLSKFNLFVQVGGVVQTTDSYSSNGNTLTFLTAPPNGYGIEVRGFATVSALVTPEDGSVTTAKLADLSVTEAKLADLSVTEAKLAAAVATKLNGAMQKATYDPSNVGQNVFDAAYHAYLQSGAGALARAVQDRLRDTLSVKDFGAVGDNSTDDTTAITNAVAQANSAGRDLLWPAGTYLTTASIANFHSVRHRGPGIVKRGTDEFRVEPKSSHSNTLYFSASGTSANDGLSSSEPKTFQTALDALANYGPTLNGSWTLKGAAGTYTNAAVDVPDVNIAGNRVLKIQGPAVSVTAGASVCFIINSVSGTFQAAETITGGTSGFTATVTAVTARKLVATMVSGTPTAGETVTGGTSGATATINSAQAVPTLLMDGTSTTSIGMKIYGKQWVEIKDIKFKAYTSRGINTNGNNLISLKNVHDEDNFFGIVVNGFGAQYFVSGGVWEKSASYAPSGTFARIQSFFGVKHHIGYSYDETTGNPTKDSSIATAPQLICAGSNAGARGIWVAENATGHMFARITDFFKGIEVVANSRVHLDNSVIHRNTWGIEWRAGCDCQIEPGADFGAGTTNENTSENLRILGGVDSINSHTFALGMWMVGSDLTTTTHTGTVAETQIGGTLYTLSGESFKTTGSLRMRIYGTITGTAGTKILRMRIGGNSISSVTFVAGATSSFVVELSVVVTGNDAQFGSGWGIAGVSGAAAGICDAFTSALAQTWGDGTDRTVTLHATLGNTADTIEVNAVELWRIG